MVGIEPSVWCITSWVLINSAKLGGSSTSTEIRCLVTGPSARSNDRARAMMSAEASSMRRCWARCSSHEPGGEELGESGRVADVPQQPPPIGAGAKPDQPDQIHHGDELLEVGEIDLPRVQDQDRPALDRLLLVEWAGTVGCELRRLDLIETRQVEQRHEGAENDRSRAEDDDRGPGSRPRRRGPRRGWSPAALCRGRRSCTATSRGP